MRMSPELVAILTTAIALAGLILNGQYRLAAQMASHVARLDARLDAIQSTIADIDRRLARVEGVLSVTHVPAEPNPVA